MTDIPVDRLGPYPIIQLAAAIVVLIGLAFAIWRGTRDKKPNSDERKYMHEQRYFFEGPLGVVTTLLKEHKDLLQRIEQHQSKIVGLGHELNHTLDDIREDVRSIKDEKFRSGRR